MKKTGGNRLQIVLVSLMLLAVPQLLFATDGEIPTVNNLNTIGQLALKQGIPVIVFVSREACPYCRSLRDKILKPMLAADKFEHRALLVEINLDRIDPMTGFENSQLTAKAFAEYYRAEITPTLLFLDSAGREISTRIVGISNLELYGFYLQKSIDAALLVIRAENLQN